MGESSRRHSASDDRHSRREPRPRRRVFRGLLGVVTFALLSLIVAGVVVPERLPRDLRVADVLRERPSRPATSAAPRPTHRPAPPVVLPPARGAPGANAESNRQALVAELETLLSAPDLGRRPGAFVYDVSAREVMLEGEAQRARTPASLAKLALAAGALLTFDHDVRLHTRVVIGSEPSEVVLVGGGDSTLVSKRPRRGSYPRPASLAELASVTAARLRGRADVPLTVSVDDSLFVGPSRSPDWEPTYVRSGIVAPVHALMVDRGRVRRGSTQRHDDPALAAGRRFARMLAAEGVDVQPDVSRRVPAPEAEVVASVSSPPLATLVETMVKTSDNDLAESLARLVADAAGLPASFRGATIALPRVLARLGVRTDQVRLRDGSGLARTSALSPELVALLLVVATEDVRLRPLLTGLPVAGFTGTLATRFGSSAKRGAGVVRAKTATLRGVAGLAGITTTGSGGVVVFAVLADEVDAARAARARIVLDRLAARLSAMP